MTSSALSKVRSDGDIAATCDLVWEFFAALKDRYPEMVETIDAYIETQGVADQLADFPTHFGPPVGECLLARVDGEPAGIVMLKRQNDDDCEMNRMYVRPLARGLGLGRRLAEELIRDAREKGYRTMYLDALYRHTEALPLYESLGFAYFTDPAAFGGDDARIIHMKLTL